VDSQKPDCSGTVPLHPSITLLTINVLVDHAMQSSTQKAHPAYSV